MCVLSPSYPSAFTVCCHGYQYFILIKLHFTIMILRYFEKNIYSFSRLSPPHHYCGFFMSTSIIFIFVLHILQCIYYFLNIFVTLCVSYFYRFKSYDKTQSSNKCGLCVVTHSKTYNSMDNIQYTVL